MYADQVYYILSHKIKNLEAKNKIIEKLESLVQEGDNPTAAIDKFNEIVAFLNSIDNTETLQELLRDVIQQSYQQNYVTVPTYASLPATGSADTIYRVSSYNGSTNQIDTTSYSEYVWDNSDYTLLCVKSQMSEVFDISAYHATGGTLATYSDLSAALDSNNGGGVPQSFQKGGMRIQFVRTYDNKYVQFRYMSSSTAVADFTNVANWQGVDSEVTYSKNLCDGVAVQKLQSSIYPFITKNNISKAIGGIRMADGRLYYVANRCRSYVINNVYDESIVFSQDPNIILWEYARYSSAEIESFIDFHYSRYQSNGNWYSDVLPKGFYYRVVFKKLDDSNFTTSDFDKIVICSLGQLRQDEQNKEQAFNNVNNTVNLLNSCNSIKFVKSYSILLNSYSIGDVVDITNLYNNTSIWSYAIADVENMQFVALKASGGIGPRAYAFLDSDRKLLYVAGESVTIDEIIEVPSNAKYLIVNDNSNGNCYCVLNGKSKDLWNRMTFSPSFIGGNPINIYVTTFAFGISETSALQFLHSRIIRVLEGTIIIIKNIKVNISVSVAFYDENWNLVLYECVHPHGSENINDIIVTVPTSAKYFIIIGKNQIGNVYYRDLDIRLDMFVNIGNPYSFAPRPSDNGYQHLTMCVGINNMASNSYTPTNELQVETEYYVDNGVLCLPESYSVDGEPTRLIIFTHGHAVNYANGATRFDTNDIKPEYWLSEGYAIMDMDGSVTGTFSGNHDYEPAAINAYETAYQWIVRYYNIRTDGVFGAGRSMGGGMQLALIRASSIPVIASVPIVPFTSPLGYVMSYITGSQRKALLKAYGVPDAVLNAVTWSSNAKRYYELTNEEKNVILEYQRLYAPYSPGYCINRPFTDSELSDYSHGGQSGDASYFNSLTESIKDSICVSAYKNIPIRMYTCVGDPTVTYRSVEWMHGVLSRAGYNVQIHVFPACADHSVVTTDHRFEINPENLITYINSKGITLTDVPKVYIEALAFWRCYENQDSQV